MHLKVEGAYAIMLIKPIVTALLFDITIRRIFCSLFRMFSKL